MAVKWLRFHISTEEDMSSIPGWRNKISKAMWRGQKKKSMFHLKGLYQAGALNPGITNIAKEKVSRGK